MQLISPLLESRVRTRSLVAIAIAFALICLSAHPAAAGTRKDPKYDVQWRVMGGAPEPTSADKARADVTRFEYTMGDKKLTFVFTYRNWTPCPSTGICDNQGTRAVLTNSTGKKVATIWATAYGANPNFDTTLRWENDVTGGSGWTCDSGQITRRASNSNDTITVKVPRSCFKKGWRLTRLEGIATLSWQDGDAWRDAWDFIDPVAIDWTPRR